MYKEKFVVSLKSDGKFLRDEDGVVKLPFGSEYELYLKNLESREAVLTISIDEKDVLNGNQLVINSNSNLNLLGFMEDNSVKNKFKFIELTKKIEDNLGYSPEDSIIRVEVWFKKLKPIVQESIITTTYKYGDPWHWAYPYYPNQYPYYTTEPYRTTVTYSCSGNSSNTVSNMNINCLRSLNDVGITVKGNECKQDFNSIYVDNLEEQSHVFILRISGYRDENKKVENVLTKKDKTKCITCGKINKYSNKFCGECGTFLENK
jgi:hypothetical protein